MNVPNLRDFSRGKDSITVRQLTRKLPYDRIGYPWRPGGTLYGSGRISGVAGCGAFSSFDCAYNAGCAASRTPGTAVQESYGRGRTWSRCNVADPTGIVAGLQG